MIKCGYKGCSKEFKRGPAIRMHRMRAHTKKYGKKKRKYTKRKKSKPSAVTMEPINYCCSCGRQLPNAIVR